MRTPLPSRSSSVGQTIDLTARATDRIARITPGDEVEIWCRSLGIWSSGFDAVDLDAEGWRVLRRSDGSPLPVRFAADEVRAVLAAHAPHRAN
jgi:hypothetical protein